MLPESRLLGGPVYTASVADLPLPPSQDLSAAVETDWLASDQRRDRTVELLSTACADGRLSLEDVSTRVVTMPSLEKLWQHQIVRGRR